MATTVIIAILAAAIGLLVGWLLSRPRTIALSERLTATEAEKERRQFYALRFMHGHSSGQVSLLRVGL